MKRQTRMAGRLDWGRPPIHMYRFFSGPMDLPWERAGQSILPWENGIPVHGCPRLPLPPIRKNIGIPRRWG